MSAPLPPSLPELMSVLDHADAAQGKREALLKAALALDTGHHPEDLEAGVTAHLEQQAHPVAVSSTPFDFGWKRPKNQEALHFEWNDSRDAQLAKQCNPHSTSAYAQKRGWWTGVISGGLLTVAGVMGMHSADGLVFGLFGVLVGLFTVVTLDTKLDGCAKRRMKYAYWAFDSYRLRAYLAYAPTRAYLQAIMSSGVPKILAGDKDVLNVLYAPRREALKEARQKKEVAEQQQKLERQVAEQNQLLTELRLAPESFAVLEQSGVRDG